MELIRKGPQAPRGQLGLKYVVKTTINHSFGTGLLQAIYIIYGNLGGEPTIVFTS